MVAAGGFRLTETMITSNVAAGGRLEGITWWNNPVDPAKNPNSLTLQIHGVNAILVLYAGQYAERHLASLDRSVVLPNPEPLWGQDDNEAMKILAAKPFKDVPAVEEQMRAAAAENIARYWRAVRGVAAALLEPHPNPEQQAFSARHPAGRQIVPASRVVAGCEVAEHVRLTSVAEAAYLRWCGRDREHGKDLEDWDWAHQMLRA